MMALFPKTLFAVAGWILVSVVPGSASQGAEELAVKAGDSATLSCVDPSHAIPSMFQWVKKDLPDGCLYFYRDAGALDSFQHPSFQKRVTLSDPNMTDGDVSLILRNVTANDTGTYECQGISSNPGRSRRGEPDVIRIISLKVEDSGNKAGNILDGGDEDKARGGQARLIIVLPVVALFALVVGVLLYLLGKNFPQPSSTDGA